MRNYKGVPMSHQNLFNRFRTSCISYGTTALFHVSAFLKWVFFGLVTGVIVGGAGACFSLSLSWANAARAAHPSLLLALPLAGLAIVFLYRFLNDKNDSGTNMVIASIQSSSEIPIQMAPSIFLSTILTQLCGGSAGREGAALQLGGSIANRLGHLFHFDDNSRHTIIMCGMSAGFAALFGTPLASAVFSMEVISIGIMHYSALVPCVVSSYTAYFIARFFHCSADAFPVSGIPAPDPLSLLRILIFGAAAALVSILFCIILHFAEHTYKKLFSNAYVRIFTAGCLVAALAALLHTGRYLGSGMTLIDSIFEEGHAYPQDFLLKILFTAVTLGAGFKGGEIVPSLTIGAAFGALLSPVLGLPSSLTAACGMAGVFCGVTNCPVTSLLISFELFGFEGMPYYLATIAASYMLSGRYGLYRAQKIIYSKTETRYINEKVH